MGNDITVIGSINMDIVVRTGEIPGIGETVVGRGIMENPGGKGANQAVALSRLGIRTGFLGMTGSDAYGERLLLSLREAGVTTDFVKSVEGSSGLAFISVDDKGSNSIIVIPGANHKVDSQYLHENIDVIKEAKIVLLQQEIPMDTVKEAIILSKGLGKTTVLNPAPASALEADILKHIDILIPNEHELARISNMEIDSIDAAAAASRALIKKGASRIITTLGDKGALYADKEGVRHFKAFATEVVDTTAAGDSFIGGFLSMYIRSADVFEAITFGQKAAAIAIRRSGAQISLPTMEEIGRYFP